MNGFIVIWRKFIEWEWYDDPNTMRLFFHCLLKANWRDKKWRGKIIKRGSFITSQDNLATELKLSRSAIRVALKKLKSTGEIHTSGQLNTLVTVCNYDSYQDKKEKHSHMHSQSIANESPMNSQLVANESPLLNKENKENKETKGTKESRRFTPPSQDEVFDLFEEKTGNRAWSENMGQMFWAHYENNGWKIGRNKMKNWKLAVSQWISRAKQEGKLPKQQEYKFDNEGNLLI